jgi:hypothetical protein
MDRFLDITLVLEIQIICIAYAMWRISKYLLNRKDKDEEI